MKSNRIIASCLAASVLVVPLSLGACGREVSHSSSTSVKDNGAVKTKEKTVTESPNGTVTKEQSEKTTSPNQ